MKRFILQRLITTVPTLVIVSIIAYAIMYLLPGDPARAILGVELGRDEVAYQALRQELGLDQNVAIQYLGWVGRAARGDMGTSIRNRQAVAEAILTRLPVTAWLTFCAVVIGLLIAVPAGVISAVKPNSKTDVVGTILALSGVAIPPFWLGIMLVLTFAVWLRWLPPTGYVSPIEDLGMSLKLVVLPAFTLATGVAAVIMRQTRAALIEVMQQDYIVVARAKGLREMVLVRRHALKNALIPVVTVIGLQTGRLLGGAVVVETVFALPGVGRLAVDSISFRDFPVVQGVILTLALAVIFANLITDILYAYIDPRIRYS